VNQHGSNLSGAAADVDYAGLGVMMAATGEPEQAYFMLRRPRRLGSEARATADRFLAEYAVMIDELRDKDARGDREAARLVGVLATFERDEITATAAFRRADERGDVFGSVGLGVLLHRAGSAREAEEAFARASQRRRRLSRSL